MSTNPINVRFPFELKGVPEDVVQAHRYAFQGLVDLNQAVAFLTNKVNTIAPSSPSTSSSSSTSITVTPGGSTSFTGLGAVRDLTGSTAYTIVNSDNGILLLLSDASPVAISLDSAMVTPYFLFASNAGAGLVTFTPTSGTINGGATYTFATGFLSIIVFDGTNWTTSAISVLPQNTPAVLHQFLTAYNSATGAFSQAQPAFTDISGSLSGAQIATYPYTAQTTTYAILATDYQIDCTSGTFTVTLPTAVGITGRAYSVKNSGAGTITVATTSAQTIDGSTTQTLSPASNMVVMSTGANWIIV